MTAEKECSCNCGSCLDCGNYAERAVLAENKRVLDKFGDFAVIVMGYTGVACCDFGKFHKDAERRLGRQISVRDLALEKTWIEIKQAYKEDFMGMSERIESFRLKEDKPM